MRWSISNDHSVGYWVAGKIDGSYWAEKSRALGLIRDGQIVAGCIYENFNGRSVVVHLAIGGRLNAAFLAALFDYGFNVMGTEKAIAPVASANVRSVALVEHMGYRLEGKIEGARPDGDILIYTMRKSDCRFLGGRYGKKLTRTPSGS